MENSSKVVEKDELTTLYNIVQNKAKCIYGNRLDLISALNFSAGVVNLSLGQGASKVTEQ
jgi:hypothetical protein